MASIRAVEATWRLPALPDEVKLDLASTPGVTPQALSDLLHGTDYDLHGDEVPEASPLLVDWQDPNSLADPSGFDQFRFVLAGVAGVRPPEDESVDAVKAWKVRAIESGLLEAPEDGVIDSRWDPSLNSVRYELLRQDYDKSLRGNRPGAMSFDSAMATLNRWTSPSGLLGAAVDLDLFWDFGAISREFDSWSAKWKKLGTSKNPLDFAGNLIDALTGPVDDIVVPALNLALLTVGVGQAVNFGRIAAMSGRAVEAGRLFDGVYDLGRWAPKMLRSADLAADVERFGQSSLLATRLQKSKTFAPLGDAMEAWRSFTPVKVTKKTVQTGMRLGLVSQAEDLLPGYQGGRSLGDVDAIARKRNSFVSSPFAWGVGEALFTPYTILEPGSFVGTLKGVGSKAAGALGSVGGRAAAGALIGGTIGLAGDDTGDVAKGAVIGATTGAALPKIGEGLEWINTSSSRRLAARTVLGAGAGVALAEATDGDLLTGVASGAGAGLATGGLKALQGRTAIEALRGSKAVGHVSDFLQTLSFKPLAQDERLTSVFDRSLRKTLSGEALSRYEDTFNSGGFTKAFGELTGLDEEAQGAALGFAFLSASLDFTASQQAKLVRDGADAARFHAYRSKLISQLRAIDLTDPTSETTMRELAQLLARQEGSGVVRKDRFDQILSELTADPLKAVELGNQQNRVAGNTLRQLLSLENLPDLDLPKHVGAWSEQTTANRLGVLDQYLPAVWDSFGNWPRFVEHSDEIARLTDDGLFESARYVQAGGRTVVPEYLTPEGFGNDVARGVVDQLMAVSGIDWSKGMFSPLARPVQLGRVTVAKADTLTKQDYLEEAARLGALAKFYEAFNSPARKTVKVLRATGDEAQLMQRTSRGQQLIDSLGEAVADLGTFDKARLDQLAQAFTLKPSDTKLLAQINAFVGANGLDARDLSSSLDRVLDQTLRDSERLKAFNLPAIGSTIDGQALDGVSLVKHWKKTLIGQSKFKAAELDMPGLLADLEASGRGDDAARLRDHMELLDRDGYKLVHGVEFLTSADLQGRTPIFSDIGRRHLNAVTLGNFFKGKLPHEAREAQELRKRTAIAGALAKVGNPDGFDLNIYSADVDRLLFDLTQITVRAQDDAALMLSDARNDSMLRRLSKRVQSSSVPVFEADLGLGINKRRLIDALEPKYGQQVAEAMWLATKSFRNAEFKDLGLYSFEAKLRKRSQLVDGLTFLAGTSNGQSMVSTASKGAIRGGVVGAVAGSRDEDGSFELGAGTLKGAAVGAGVGAVAQAATAKAVEKSGIIDKAEWSRYGYLADNLARLRDTLRFTLSPMFDASRFTESLMLNQLGTTGVGPDGKRLVMPLNSSPKALVKRFAKEFTAEGEERATRLAQAKFDRVRDEYVAAARGMDFDPEALDTTARWFQSVGILGFDPTAWQTSAFAHLREQGLSPADAYGQVRKMYSYGTRSAAELSVNFVLFPFSFQKKLMKDSAKWLADDFSRSVMLHDALKAYEVLNDRFDLNERWKEHMPLLENLQRLNAFAFGISAGQLGGINRPFIEAGTNAVLNLFTPQGLSISNAAEAADLQKLTRKLLPVYNDLRYMLEDGREQLHVLTSPRFQTRAAEAAQGYEEWNTFKAEVAAELTSKGYTFAQLMRNPALAEAKLAYQQKKLEIGDRLPGWRESMQKAATKRVELQMEKSDRLARAQADPASATLTDVQLFQFEQQLDQLRAWMDQQGIEDFADLPVETWDAIHRVAVANSRTNPQWGRIWNQFFQRDFGPLSGYPGQ